MLRKSIKYFKNFKEWTVMRVKPSRQVLVVSCFFKCYEARDPRFLNLYLCPKQHRRNENLTLFQDNYVMDFGVFFFLSFFVYLWYRRICFVLNIWADCKRTHIDPSWFLSSWRLKASLILNNIHEVYYSWQFFNCHT